MNDSAGLTPDQLEALRQLAAEAWPGPWEKFGNTVTLKLKGGVVHTITLPGDHQTLAFIAAARQAVPQLISELEELRRQFKIMERYLIESTNEAKRLEAERQIAIAQWTKANTERDALRQQAERLTTALRQIAEWRHDDGCEMAYVHLNYECSCARPGPWAIARDAVKEEGNV